MLIKICGMRDSANIEEIAHLKPDLMGFIFYPKSKRYVGVDFNVNLVKSVMPEIQTTGVFVNEDINNLLSIASKYHFDFVQLHGNESPMYCQKAIDNGFKVLKAFGIYVGFDWRTIEPYQQVCHYLLFDTSSKDHGGSGQKFNWNILSDYTGDKPFILSGGIKPEDAGLIDSFKHKKFAGIDINSGFEFAPGMKNPAQVQKFINELRTTQIKD